MSRFDHIAYDETSKRKSAELKAAVQTLEKVIETTLPNGRPKSLALTSLEESFMWCGKAVRDEQILERTAAVDELPEEKPAP